MLNNAHKRPSKDSLDWFLRLRRGPNRHLPWNPRGGAGSQDPSMAVEARIQCRAFAIAACRLQPPCSMQRRSDLFQALLDRRHRLLL